MKTAKLVGARTLSLFLALELLCAISQGDVDENGTENPQVSLSERLVPSGVTNSRKIVNLLKKQMMNVLAWYMSLKHIHVSNRRLSSHLSFPQAVWLGLVSALYGTHCSPTQVGPV